MIQRTTPKAAPSARDAPVSPVRTSPAMPWGSLPGRPTWNTKASDTGCESAEMPRHRVGPLGKVGPQTHRDRVETAVQVIRLSVVDPGRVGVVDAYRAECDLDWLVELHGHVRG